MKRLIFIILIILVSYLLNAKIIKTKDKIVIKGKIIEMNEDYTIIETADGNIKINSENIIKIYHDENKYYEEVNNNIENDFKNITKKDKENFMKNNKDYKLSKRLLGIGIAFVSTGTIIFFSSIPFCILGNDITFRNNYYNNKIFPLLDKQTKSIILFSVGTSLLAIGLTLDIISIVIFVKSSKHYKKFKESYNQRFSFNLTFGSLNNPAIGLKFRIKI